MTWSHVEKCWQERCVIQVLSPWSQPASHSSKWPGSQQYNIANQVSTRSTRKTKLPKRKQETKCKGYTVFLLIWTTANAMIYNRKSWTIADHQSESAHSEMVHKKKEKQEGSTNTCTSKNATKWKDKVKCLISQPKPFRIELDENHIGEWADGLGESWEHSNLSSPQDDGKLDQRMLRIQGPTLASEGERMRCNRRRLLLIWTRVNGIQITSVQKRDREDGVCYADGGRRWIYVFTICWKQQHRRTVMNQPTFVSKTIQRWKRHV